MKEEIVPTCDIRLIWDATWRLDDHQLRRADPVVLVRCRDREYLHLVKAIQGGRYQIGNNRGRINGWVSGNAIFGRCVRVEA